MALRSLRSIALLGLLLQALCLAGCGGEDQATGRADSEGARATSLVKVTPVRPQRKTLVRRTEQPGQIEAFEETPLFAKVSGYVARIHVDIGDRVTGPKLDERGAIAEPGQLLVELDVPELAEEHRQKQAVVVQAQAGVRQAAAAVKVAEAARTSARAKIDEAQAAVDRALADAQRYRSELSRTQGLAEKGAVTRQVVDEKENLFRAAEAARSEVAARIESARAGLAESEARLEQARADQDAAQAKVGVAEADERRVAALLGYTRILAPYDGVISVRNVHPGHLVHPGTATGGTPLLVITRIDKVRLFIDVPETDAVFVADGSDARIRIPSLSAESFSGEVTRSAWMLMAGTRTLRTEIDIDNREGRLRPGMFASVDLKVAERADAFALPHTALWIAEGRTWCYTIDESGHVARQAITSGIRAGDEVEILSGLSGDERVIGANPSAFREGQQVEVVERGRKP